MNVATIEKRGESAAGSGQVLPFGARWIAALTASALVAFAPLSSAAPPPPSGAPAPAPRVGYTPPPPSATNPAPPGAAPRILPPPSQQAARTGRYRLTLLGASAYRQTKAGALGGALASDTVFFVTDILPLSEQGAEAAARRVSWTYGRVDSRGPVIHGDWIRTGSAGVDGGIKSGDTLPYAQPWIRKQPAGPLRLPQVVWEGRLVDGVNCVLIGPTVWKREDGKWLEGRFRLLAASPANMARLMLADLQPSPELFKAITEIARSRAPVVPLPALLNATAIPRLSASDQAGSGIGGAAKALTSSDRPIGVTYMNGAQVFIPKVLILNYAAAERLLAPSQAPSVPNFFGSPVQMPSGIVLVRFQDDPGLGGDYELFFQIERIQ